jgi:aminopeptidase
MNKSYIPSQKILEKYADVLVNFALGGGTGIKKGEVVYVWAKECSKPLFVEACKAVWRAGGHVITAYSTNESERRGSSADFYKIADNSQLDFFPEKFYRGLLEEMDHQLAILGEEDPEFLKGVDSKKVLRYGKTLRPFIDWRNEKENAGKLTWTLCLYGTPAMAKEARMSEKEYWNQIIKACYLDKPNPISEWKRAAKMVEACKQKLNKLKIEKVHIEGPDADLWVKIGERRAWNGGTGRNIPSFEIFTSPDWRGTNGWIRFNQPLYRYGNLIEGIELEFKDGRVVKSRAKKNEKVLKDMIATENADKVGEYSLTDKRLSRITKFMAETLFDENMGGPHGNTHLALGSSYHDCFDGDPSKISKKEWERLGYNDSSVHTDIISTTTRTVTAYLPGGKTKVIYKNGQFTL